MIINLVVELAPRTLCHFSRDVNIFRYRDGLRRQISALPKSQPLRIFSFAITDLRQRLSIILTFKFYCTTFVTPMQVTYTESYVCTVLKRIAFPLSTVYSLSYLHQPLLKRNERLLVGKGPTNQPHEAKSLRMAAAANFVLSLPFL